MVLELGPRGVPPVVYRGGRADGRRVREDIDGAAAVLPRAADRRERVRHGRSPRVAPRQAAQAPYLRRRVVAARTACHLAARAEPEGRVRRAGREVVRYNTDTKTTL